MNIFARKKRPIQHKLNSSIVFTKDEIVDNILTNLTAEDLYIFQHVSGTIYSMVHSRMWDFQENYTITMKQIFECCVHRPDFITDFKLKVMFHNHREFDFIIKFYPNEIEAKSRLRWCTGKSQLKAIYAFLKSRKEKFDEKQNWDNVKICLMRKRFGKAVEFRSGSAVSRVCRDGAFGFVIGGDVNMEASASMMMWVDEQKRERFHIRINHWFDPVDDEGMNAVQILKLFSAVFDE